MRIYCGVPAANSAFHDAEEVFAQVDAHLDAQLDDQDPQ